MTTTWSSTRGGINAFRGWDRFDFILTFAAVALVVLGLLLIYSGSDRSIPLTNPSNPVLRQVVFAGIGFVAMLIVSRIDYHYFIHYATPLYVIGLISLVAVFLLGSAAYGSKRWFDLGFVQVQPSEFAKLATIFLLAHYFSERGGDAKDVRAFLISLAIVVPATFLVFIEPDLGTAIVFLAIWLGVTVIAGVNRRHLLIMTALGLAIFPFVFTFAIEDYQIDRISVLADPEEDPLGDGYNVLQSQIAVGSGGWTGKGLLQGEQTNLGYLKVPTKDFIFSVLAEELGFVGAMGLFALFILLLFRGIRAAQIAGDPAGQLIAVGIVVLILMQTFINVAVNVSLFPVTGIPLPFVSQGGSSLVSMFVSLGVLQSIIMRHRAYRQN